MTSKEMLRESLAPNEIFHNQAPLGSKPDWIKRPKPCYCGQCGPVPAGVKPHPCKGGFSPRRVAAALVLSAILSPIAARAAEPCKVNVNTASPAQLALLINTGPALAGKIAAARTAGPLDAAKLDAVPGVGPKWIEYNTPHVSYSGETTCKDKLKKPAAVKPEAAGGGR